jgi:hypothetical protein
MKDQTDVENARQIVRYRGDPSVEFEEGKVARTASPGGGNKKNDNRSQYMYENKQNNDNLSAEKGEYFA